MSAFHDSMSPQLGSFLSSIAARDMKSRVACRTFSQSGASESISFSIRANGARETVYCLCITARMLIVLSPSATASDGQAPDRQQTHHGNRDFHRIDSPSSQ